MTYYLTVHKDEDQQSLLGEFLDPTTSHMVFDSGYDLDQMRNIVEYHPWKVIWEMEREPKAKFGWKFHNLVGIPL